MGDNKKIIAHHCKWLNWLLVEVKTSINFFSYVFNGGQNVSPCQSLNINSTFNMLLEALMVFMYF